MKTSIIHLSEKDYPFIDDVLERSGTLGRYFALRYRKLLSYAELLTPRAPARDYSFEWGGVGTCYTDRLVKWLHRELTATQMSVLLYNECARSSHKRVHDFLYPLYFRREVYHLIKPSFGMRNIQQSIIEAGTGISLVGVLFNDVDVAMLRDSHILGKTLQACLQSTKTMIMGVYDGEMSLMLHFKKQDLES